MGKQLAVVLSDAINARVRRDFTRTEVIRSLAIKAYVHASHVESLLAGTGVPDNITLVGLARALDLDESRLYAALQTDLADKSAPPPPEKFFDIPGEGDDETADAAQDAS